MAVGLSYLQARPVVLCLAREGSGGSWVGPLAVSNALCWKNYLLRDTH